MGFLPKRPRHILSIFLGVYFIWLGVQIFVDPSAWIAGWVPFWAISLFSSVGARSIDLALLTGIAEVLIGVGLIAGYFTRLLAVVGLFIVVLSGALHGFHEAFIRLGSVGALVALLWWPYDNA